MSEMHRTYRFAQGQLVESAPPEWFSVATDHGSWPAVLIDAGATFVEDFGDGDLEIFRGPEGDYFIGIWDPNSCIAQVFIDNMADYLTFRAEYVAPLAQLIMETERHDKWRNTQKRKVA